MATQLNPFWRRIEWALLALFALLIIALIPIPTGVSYYRLAGKINQATPAPKEYVGARSSEDYLIQNGTLYLKNRSEANALLLMWGFPTHWDAAKLQTLLQSHPLLKDQLPDPSQPNGGVSWITN